MKNKLFIFVLLGVLLLASVSATCSGTDLGIFKQGSTIELRQVCDSCSYVTLSSIVYPNSSFIYVNENMSKNGIDYNYSFSNTSQMGIYQYSVVGDKDGNPATETFCFEITYSGQSLSTANSIFYAILICILSLIMVGVFIGAGKLERENKRDGEGELLSINWTKYFREPLYFISWMLFIAILYISSNLAFSYLGEQLFAKVIFVLFRVCFGITPLIVVVWFIWFFVMIFRERQFQKAINRGLHPRENKKRGSSFF